MFPNGLSYIDVDGILNSSNEVTVADADADVDAAAAAADVDADADAAVAVAIDDDDDCGSIGSFKLVFDERDK